jgi:hypothetical protein
MIFHAPDCVAAQYRSRRALRIGVYNATTVELNGIDRSLKAAREDRFATGHQVEELFKNVGLHEEGHRALCRSDVMHARIPKKQKARLSAGFCHLAVLEKSGAGEGIRTLDPDLGKVVLYH